MKFPKKKNNIKKSKYKGSVFQKPRTKQEFKKYYQDQQYEFFGKEIGNKQGILIDDNYHYLIGKKHGQKTKMPLNKITLQRFMQPNNILYPNVNVQQTQILKDQQQDDNNELVRIQQPPNIPPPINKKQGKMIIPKQENEIIYDQPIPPKQNEQPKQIDVEDFQYLPFHPNNQRKEFDLGVGENEDDQPPPPQPPPRPFQPFGGNSSDSDDDKGGKGYNPSQPPVNEQLINHFRPFRPFSDRKAIKHNNSIRSSQINKPLKQGQQQIPLRNDQQQNELHGFMQIGQDTKQIAQQKAQIIQKVDKIKKVIEQQSIQSSQIENVQQPDRISLSFQFNKEEIPNEIDNEFVKAIKPTKNKMQKKIFNNNLIPLNNEIIQDIQLTQGFSQADENLIEHQIDQPGNEVILNPNYQRLIKKQKKRLLKEQREKQIQQSLNIDPSMIYHEGIFKERAGMFSLTPRPTDISSMQIQQQQQQQQQQIIQIMNQQEEEQKEPILYYQVPAMQNQQIMEIEQDIQQLQTIEQEVQQSNNLDQAEKELEVQVINEQIQERQRQKYRLDSNYTQEQQMNINEELEKREKIKQQKEALKLYFQQSRIETEKREQEYKIAKQKVMENKKQQDLLKQEQEKEMRKRESEILKQELKKKIEENKEYEKQKRQAKAKLLKSRFIAKQQIIQQKKLEEEQRKKQQKEDEIALKNKQIEIEQIKEQERIAEQQKNEQEQIRLKQKLIEANIEKKEIEYLKQLNKKYQEKRQKDLEEQQRVQRLKIEKKEYRGNAYQKYKLKKEEQKLNKLKKNKIQNLLKRTKNQDFSQGLARSRLRQANQYLEILRLKEETRKEKSDSYLAKIRAKKEKIALKNERQQEARELQMRLADIDRRNALTQEEIDEEDEVPLDVILFRNAKIKEQQERNKNIQELKTLEARIKPVMNPEQKQQHVQRQNEQRQIEENKQQIQQQLRLNNRTRITNTQGYSSVPLINFDQVLDSTQPNYLQIVQQNQALENGGFSLAGQGGNNRMRIRK